MGRALDEWRRGDHAAAFLLDVDGMERVNAAHGSERGDLLLYDLAVLLRSRLSSGDVVARLDGGTFAGLLHRYDRASLLAVPRRLLKVVARHPFGTGPAATLRITASMGVVGLDGPLAVDDVLRRAEIALYEAKNRGRDRLVLFEDVEQEVAAESRDLEIRHFENVTKVTTERVTSLMTHMGRNLVETAQRQANQDALTGLHNFRYFRARLEREREAARKHGRALTIALMDLDHFHDVNLTYGWPTGNRVLEQFAETASANVRTTDWLARYGGEEFCLVMPDTDRETGRLVADRVRQAAAERRVASVDGREVRFTVSVGVAQLSPADVDPVAFANRASEALKRAKNDGRNRVILADD